MSGPNQGTPTSTSKTGIQTFDFPGYDGYGLISAATVIPPNRRIVTTSGHTGRDENGVIPSDLEEEITLHFQKIEKSIKAVDPSLTSEQVWQSVYTLTSYTTAGFGKEELGILTKVALKLFGEHRPAWSLIGVKDLNNGVRFETNVQAAIP